MATNMVIRQGDVGIGVNKIQGYLNLMQEKGYITTRNFQDGVFGANTLQALQQYQRYANLPISNVIDYDTFSSLVNKLKELGIVTNIPLASSIFFLSYGSQGLSVYMMQEYLNEIAQKNPCLKPVLMDGLFGVRTQEGVRQFQYLYDLNIDGIIGKQTWDSIVNTRNGLS